MANIQSIMQYNGGSVIAMVGKDCVAIASDLRLGVQSLSISSNFEKVRTLLYCFIMSLTQYGVLSALCRYSQ